ncbi:CpaF family protein [Kitasatospora sp. NPDC058965]|uniref:CpaF family protein n=1 Tax=Kitasatospora sp. NPDC058965 TaxID=3346682 RepID=UPI00369E2366
MRGSPMRDRPAELPEEPEHDYVVPGPVRPSAGPAGQFAAPGPQAAQAGPYAPQTGPYPQPNGQHPQPAGQFTVPPGTGQPWAAAPPPPSASAVPTWAAQPAPTRSPVPSGPAAAPNSLPVLPTPPTPAPPVVDPQVARELKRQVAAELHQQLSKLTTSTPGLEIDRATRRQRGRALIEEVVARWSDAYAQTHGAAPTRDQDRALAEAVYDLLFRAGRLQPYLDDPEIENILINGCDDVWVSRVHQPLKKVPPVADSDAELIELLQDLARQHGGGERSLNTANPTLALRLEGGMRLQAMTEVTPRPYVAIRRHRVASATLADMVALGTVDSTLAAFLAAAIRARKNVMITGTQGVGKTSMLRAMAAEIPPDERIGTLESEFELWLHTLGHLRQVVPMEAREGNGERIDGKVAGELSIGELIPAALRMTLSRIIVGEVRSGEVVPMLRVMTNGEGGSMCTLHARGPHMVVDRIAELCLEYGAHMTDTLAYRLTANAVDLIVHVSMVDETAVGGRRHRFVSHVLEVTGLGENGRPALNTVFGPRPDLGEPRAVPHTPPNCLDDLRRAGFDAGLLQSAYGSWQAPLALRIGGVR